GSWAKATALTHQLNRTNNTQPLRCNPRLRSLNKALFMTVPMKKLPASKNLIAVPVGGALGVPVSRYSQPELVVQSRSAFPSSANLNLPADCARPSHATNDPPL